MKKTFRKVAVSATLGTTVMFFGANAALADSSESVRPGVEVRSLVAKNLLEGNERAGGFHWGHTATSEGLSHTPAAVDAKAFRWGDTKVTLPNSVARSASSGESVALQQGFRWGIKSNADQQGFRWGIKSSADQQGFRWGIKSNSEQQGFRWGIKSNSEQQGFRWGIKGNFDQQGFRWGIKSVFDQQGFRWGIKVANAIQE